MSIDISLLKEICEINGAPGFENKIRNLIMDQVRPLVDELSVDNIGNVIAINRGSSNKKVMVAAHMDEIGFMIKHIDDNGFIRFTTLGGFDPKTLTAQRVIIHGKEDVIGVMGSKPIHVMSPEERNKPAKIDDFFIDTGRSKEDLEKIVAIGDPITRERSLIEMGDCVNCKSLDNRISVYILIQTLKELRGKEIPYDFYAAFTVQEEVGLRGAKVAAQTICPDFGLGLDTTIAYDVPTAAAHEYVTSLGKGVAIKIMDASAIADQRIVRYLKALAQDNSIKWQPEILTAGGTDTAAIQQTGQNGTITGAISIPTRHIHQVIEMVHKDDVLNAVTLLTLAIQNFDQFDVNY